MQDGAGRIAPHLHYNLHGPAISLSAEGTPDHHLRQKQAATQEEDQNYVKRASLNWWGARTVSCISPSALSCTLLHSCACMPQGGMGLTEANRNSCSISSRGRVCPARWHTTNGCSHCPNFAPFSPLTHHMLSLLFTLPESLNHSPHGRVCPVQWHTACVTSPHAHPLKGIRGPHAPASPEMKLQN